MTGVRGSRVRLRAFRPEEFDILWSAARSASQTVAVGAIDPEELRKRVGASGRMTEREILFAIETEDRLIGSIQGYRGHVPAGVYGIGIEIFDPADRGRGFGREAVALLVSHLFGRDGSRRVEAGTAVDNMAMRRVFRTLGFVEEGVLRRWYPSDDGRGTDCVMYGMTRDDWENESERWTFRS